MQEYDKKYYMPVETQEEANGEYNAEIIDVDEATLSEFVQKQDDEGNVGIFSLKNVKEFAARRLNYNIVKKIGDGGYGAAYMTDNGTVLKLTESAREAVNSAKLINKKNTHYAEIYTIKQIGKIPFLFLIEKEYLQGLSKEEQELVDIVVYANTVVGANDVEAFKEYISQYKQFDEAKRQRLIEMFSHFLEMASDFKKMGVHANDINSSNVGYDSNNKIACFDCFYGDGGEIEQKEIESAGEINDIDSFSEYVRGAIEEATRDDDYYISPISHSKTDFGNSNYIHVAKTMDDYYNRNFVKIRISDHSVLNTQRIFNEIHIPFPYPQMFIKKEGKYVPNIEYVIKNIHFNIDRSKYFDKKEGDREHVVYIEVSPANLRSTDKILSERLSSERRGGGRTIYSIERRSKVPTVQWIYKKDNTVFREYDKAHEMQTAKYEDGGEILLAPNGNPSNLTPEQYRLVRTPEFISWFGNWLNDPENASKVVDENGEPIVVHHGSTQEFNIFERKESRGGLKEYGHHFSTNIEVAKIYGNIVKPFFLNLKKIKRFDAKRQSNIEAWRNLEVNAGYKIANNRDALEFLKEGRFGIEKVDGVAAENIADLFIGVSPSDKDIEKYLGTTYLVFDGNENLIKLADGTNKTFDMNNPDIRYKDGGGIANKIHKSIPKELQHFIPIMQAKTVNHYLKGEEAQGFSETIDRLLSIVGNMPNPYETDNIEAKDKIIHLHYFTNRSDWFIAEKDSSEEQHQAFGYAILNGDIQNAEWDYIPISELKTIPQVELDFHWTPKTFKEAMEKQGYWQKEQENEEQQNKKDMDKYQEPKTEISSEDEVKISFDPSVYKNAYELNIAIQDFIDQTIEKPLDEFTSEEKKFIELYSGMGGLDKFGASGKGILYEYYTPDPIIEKMWALAYKYGFKPGMKVIEPAAGIGRFCKYLPLSSNDKEDVRFDELVKDPFEAIVKGFSMYTAIEPNKYSARILKILYPFVEVINGVFEQMFLMQNKSIKSKIENMTKYHLCIGNPPYGKFEGLYAGMGEKSYTQASNYIEYFIFRGLDTLHSGGLLIYIVGAEVAAGGIPFLKSGINNCKKAIEQKADLIDAYRLPNGVFDRTDVLTDIIVLRKK